MGDFIKNASPERPGAGIGGDAQHHGEDAIMRSPPAGGPAEAAELPEVSSSCFVDRQSSQIC